MWNEKELAVFHQLHRRNLSIVHSNRQRMNYLENEYQRVFRDLFHNVEGKRLYLFGSENYIKKFPSQFGADYEITGILDNNSGKWGMQMGHLNMFKRAKEQCDYLIVGIVTDEAVIRDKKTGPYIPFEERIGMVRSCRYMDETVEIPADLGIRMKLIADTALMCNFPEVTMRTTLDGWLRKCICRNRVLTWYFPVYPKYQFNQAEGKDFKKVSVRFLVCKENIL